MPFLTPQTMLCLAAAVIISSDWITLGRVEGQRGDDMSQETFTDDPNLFSELNTDESECRDEKFACTRLYSVHRPVKQCVHQVCFTSLRRMYIINNEICSRMVCKEHEAMKDELCRQMAGLPPRRLRRSNYFRLPPCEDTDLPGARGL
ncbi:PREDICTED: microfibrillar-associated protein 5 isoform X3 [Dipodomys ordii]|uniref:Microfibrillar-associated protein 5 isoform X3 n=1 Tax=Dipodomys ordii TaxID=10020 RepID=A0A1S3FRF5_DIPOR|nr:PREDICTED: microfibrillar-associated protein 5 isoform X3 [Dipodomys ordii]